MFWDGRVRSRSPITPEGDGSENVQLLILSLNCFFLFKSERDGPDTGHKMNEFLFLWSDSSSLGILSHSLRDDVQKRREDSEENFHTIQKIETEDPENINVDIKSKN